jgi:[acyl-carrier-protein] S-malonyltransferase
MGRALAEAFPTCRTVFDEADRALGLPLSSLCFAGSAEELALTENTQPAILTVSVAALRELERRGLRPAAAAGHSLGEYAAHVAAGTLDWLAALRTVRLRGRFMQEAVPAGQGAMAAVLGLPAEAVEEVCRAAAHDGEIVSAANFNAPGQIVIAGHAGAVDRALQAAPREAGAKRAVRLAVSAPFHCALMQPAADRLRTVLAELRFAAPSFPVYVNVDARPVRSGEAAREALERQVVAPVRWQACAEALADDGIDTFVEVGPGHVLAGLLRRTRDDLRVLSAGEPAELEAAAAELSS